MTSGDAAFLLHHYEQSPYAHKIRAMFGLAGAEWGSVLAPPYPPRPGVEPLVGGYRRIPVAQIGADVFCDSRLIAVEVAALTGRTELGPQVEDPAARALAERAEREVFFAAITSVSPLKLLGVLLRTSGPVGTLKFVRDRKGMMRGARVRPPQGAAARQLFDAFLSDLDSHLSSQSMLSGEEPTYADFCVYHPIWLARSVGGARSLPSHRNVARWLHAMDDLGQGQRQEQTAEDAFAAARACEPRSLPSGADSGELLGKKVSILPDDYARVGTSGTLVAVAPDRYIIARESERVGTVHVHFPREGYEITD